MKVTMPVAGELSTYYQSYLKYLDTDDMLDALKKQQKSTKEFWASIPGPKETFRYADGKWSVRELAGHLCDTERILTYRALRFARKDDTPLSGFDENQFTANANYHDIALADIAGQHEIIRESTIRLFQTFTPEMYTLGGLANNSQTTVRGILFFIIAHEIHHLGVVKERYLGS
jgi:uncharacterized damage-inducible protein DinB